MDLAGGEGAALGASGGLLTRLGEQHLAEIRNGQGILLAAGLLLGRADRDVVLLLRARLQLVLSVDLAKINETMPKPIIIYDSQPFNFDRTKLFQIILIV